MGRITRPRFKSFPKWSDKKGWHGGDSRTLYAFTDHFTGAVRVRPVTGCDGAPMSYPGPNCDVRVATREEATRLWQDPLSPGWKVQS